MSALEDAEAIQVAEGYVGDRADLTLTYRAKLADDRDAALALLDEAEAVQVRLGNRLGEARTLLLKARLSSSPAVRRAACRRVVRLRRELPGLKNCRLMRTIGKNWSAWISGENRPRHRDKFWCL